MAKHKPARRAKTRKPQPKRKRATAARTAKTRNKKKTKKPKRRRTSDIVQRGKAPRLDRVRRTLNDDVVPTPPSSLNMDRHGSAARTGRAEIEQHRRQRGNMSSVTSGDPDINVDNAYFSGDEAPGGDNPTPDQDIVDDIGKALGVEYNDNEELRSGDKVRDRDKHRWELDPASSEDYRERD